LKNYSFPQNRLDPGSDTHLTFRASFATFLLWICDSSGVSQNLAPAGALAAPRTRPASKIQAVGVVILARNHSESIAKCIASIFAANSHSGWRNSLWIVVVADSCTDDTAKAARTALGAFGQVLEICAHSRQAAHELGTATVMEHFRQVSRHTLLLTSADASAELPRDWIDWQLQCSQSPTGLASSR
jgi:hypothetical protein